MIHKISKNNLIDFSKVEKNVKRQFCNYINIQRIYEQRILQKNISYFSS